MTQGVFGIFGKFALVALMAVGAQSGNAWATDAEAQATFETAKALYEQRADQAKNDQAIETLKVAETQVVDAELKYDILVLSARAYYWKGQAQTTDGEKIRIFQLAMEKAAAARDLNNEYADAYYYYAISLGRWAEANGILKSLFEKDNLMGNAQAAIDKDTRAGDLGETIDGYGPARTLGRVYFKLPGFAGGNYGLALENLAKAYNNAKDLALNVVYYAEALNNGNSEQKALARKILDEMLAQDPATYNTSRTPETMLEFETARRLRKEMR